jgi:RNA polymerase sigma-70 factor (ECF subfamily)
MGGDRDRLESCFDAHYDSVLRFLRRRMDVAEDAEDAATDVFAVACRRSDAIPPEPETLLWLYGVARNVLSNYRRAARRRGNLHARLIHHHRDGAQVDPIGARDSADAVLAAFRSLSETDRDLLSLVAWEGLTTAQIAVVLGIPRPVASARLYRARCRLASRLDASDAHRAPATRLLRDGVEHA